MHDSAWAVPASNAENDVRPVPANGFVFQVHRWGPADARPVLLLHGWPQDASAWDAVAPLLATGGYQVFAPDQRGYAPTAQPKAVGDYAMAHLVGDVLGLLGALGHERVDLVGHDWGGAVAWCVAGMHPERVRTLSVASTPHPLALGAAIADQGTDQAARSAYMEFFRLPEHRAEDALLTEGAGSLSALYADTGLPAARAARYLERLSDRETLTASLNWYRAMRAADYTGAREVTVPTLYVWGSDDPALGRAAAEGSAAYVTGPYRFVELEGAGHWIPETEAETFARLVLAHLAAN